MQSGLKLAGASWSWVGATLAESVAIYRALGVGAIDLISIPGKSLDTYQIAGHPKKQASLMRGLEAELSNLLMFFGVDFRDRALNSADAAVRRANLDTFQRVLEFCAAANCPSVTVLPGVEQPGLTREVALELTATELNRMNELARAAGVLLVYEPHVESILEKPADVLEFVPMNSNVKIVIDYSHAVSLGFALCDLEPLVSHAGHVHLRQARPGRTTARNRKRIAGDFTRES